MGNMSVSSYLDENFQKSSKPDFTFPVDPEKVSLTKGIQYEEDKELGSLNGANSFVRYRPEQLYFECLFDMTSVMEDNDESISVHDMVNRLEERLYDYNKEMHRPAFVRAIYGNIIFMGQLQSLETQYTLFDLKGNPIRAELKVTLVGYCSKEMENKLFSKRSPDVSRLVTLKAGQTLAALCNEIYGNPLLVGQVARFNNLNGYRNIPAGTKILMPMLVKS